MEPNGIQEEDGGNGREGEEGIGRDKKKYKSNAVIGKNILVVERMKSENRENLEGSKMKSVYPRKIGILIFKI